MSLRALLCQSLRGRGDAVCPPIVPRPVKTRLSPAYSLGLFLIPLLVRVSWLLPKHLPLPHNCRHAAPYHHSVRAFRASRKRLERRHTRQ